MIDNILCQRCNVISNVNVHLLIYFIKQLWKLQLFAFTVFFQQSIPVFLLTRYFLLSYCYYFFISVNDFVYCLKLCKFIWLILCIFANISGKMHSFTLLERICSLAKYIVSYILSSILCCEVHRQYKKIPAVMNECNEFQRHIHKEAVSNF